MTASIRRAPRSAASTDRRPGSESCVLELGHLEVAHDGRQRRAQLVGHGVHQLGAVVVDLAQAGHQGPLLLELARVGHRPAEVVADVERRVVLHVRPRRVVRDPGEDEEAEALRPCAERDEEHRADADVAEEGGQDLSSSGGQARVLAARAGEVGDVLGVPLAAGQHCIARSPMSSRRGRPWSLSEYHVLDRLPSEANAESHRPVASERVHQRGAAGLDRRARGTARPAPGGRARGPRSSGGPAAPAPRARGPSAPTYASRPHSVPAPRAGRRWVAVRRPARPPSAGRAASPRRRRSAQPGGRWGASPAAPRRVRRPGRSCSAAPRRRPGRAART